MSNLNGTYVLDPTHSEIAFITRHAGVTRVRGLFSEYTSEITVDTDTPASNKATATIEVKSISTGNQDRDMHLLNKDFFEQETYPTITFESTEIPFTGQDEFEVTGNLTIKGITKPVTLQVEFLGTAEDPFGNTRIGFSARTKVNRKDFGVDFNVPLRAGGFLVSEEIRVEVEGSAIPKA